MWYLNKGFIGGIPNTVEEFLGSDTLPLYEKNLASKPIDWYYRSKTLTYKLNNLGHRCQNPEDIDLSNYILFLGCSHTMGIGNYLEDTFPYLTSQKLNIDYYNLGIGASGTDSMFHNLVVWMNQFCHKPKHIIWQWPDLARYATISSNDEVIMHGIWEKNPEVVNFMVMGHCNDFHISRMRFIIAYLGQLNVPITYVSTDAKNKDDPSNTVYYRWIDKDNARDNMHMGIKSNELLANQLAELLR